jgi:hypothetical protein
MVFNGGSYLAARCGSAAEVVAKSGDWKKIAKE